MSVAESPFSGMGGLRNRITIAICRDRQSKALFLTIFDPGAIVDCKDRFGLQPIRCEFIKHSSRAIRLPTMWYCDQHTCSLIRAFGSRLNIQ